MMREESVRELGWRQQQARWRRCSEDQAHHPSCIEKVGGGDECVCEETGV
jgi:hypothetical protein